MTECLKVKISSKYLGESKAVVATLELWSHNIIHIPIGVHDICTHTVPSLNEIGSVNKYFSERSAKVTKYKHINNDHLS